MGAAGCQWFFFAREAGPRGLEAFSECFAFFHIPLFYREFVQSFGRLGFRQQIVPLSGFFLGMFVGAYCVHKPLRGFVFPGVGMFFLF